MIDSYRESLFNKIIFFDPYNTSIKKEKIKDSKKFLKIKILIIINKKDRYVGHKKIDINKKILNNTLYILFF